MHDESGPLVAERRFFAALLASNVEALEQVLADDFMMIDVVGGSEITREALLAVIASGQLRFEAIELLDSRVRAYQAAAVITGRTQLNGRFGVASFTADSRYTHVFIEQQSRWRLVAAQGTLITPDSDPAAPGVHSDGIG